MHFGIFLLITTDNMTNSYTNIAQLTSCKSDNKQLLRAIAQLSKTYRSAMKEIKYRIEYIDHIEKNKTNFGIDRHFLNTALAESKALNTRMICEAIDLSIAIANIPKVSLKNIGVFNYILKVTEKNKFRKVHD